MFSFTCTEFFDKQGEKAAIFGVRSVEGSRGHPCRQYLRMYFQSIVVAVDSFASPRASSEDTRNTLSHDLFCCCEVTPGLRKPALRLVTPFVGLPIFPSVVDPVCGSPFGDELLFLHVSVLFTTPCRGGRYPSFCLRQPDLHRSGRGRDPVWPLLVLRD